jgi:hypothetical protein
MQQSDHEFQSRQDIANAISTLKGVLKGLDIDGQIDSNEIHGLKLWISTYAHLQHLHPFTELLPALQATLQEGRLGAQRKADLLWLCHTLTADTTLDRISASLHEMQGVLAGLLIDGELTEKELLGLREWLQRNQHLRTCWPYDEVDSLVCSVLESRKITSDELELLQDFLSCFLGIEVEHQGGNQADDVPYSLTGICARDPRIEWQNKHFCLTGNFAEPHLDRLIRQRGGQVIYEVSPELDYLIVGSEGNPCWAYACYGRRIEQAIALRRAGHPLVIVHEFDATRALASR